MASLVDLCNLALSRLGDEASVVSIDPVDGSAQSVHCARFLPMVRDSLLSMRPWAFATAREALAERVKPSSVTMWAYAYALPNQCLTMLSVLPQYADDDTLSGNDAMAAVPYSVELDPDGARVLYTDEPYAFARYVKRVEDPNSWSPLFAEALVWRLAAAVAGPLLKGQTGMQQGLQCERMAAAVLSSATDHDANQNLSRMQQTPPKASWLSVR